MSGEHTSGEELDEELGAEAKELDDLQKRRLRAVRRGYRAGSVAIKNNGWELEITYLDGSVVTVNSKLIKLKAGDLAAPC